MIGDIHPRFPLLSVAREDENGTPTSWRTKGPYWSLDDPRILLIRDRAGRVLKGHPSYTDAFDDKSGIPNRQAADTETRSGLLEVW
jgi:hypothetical protein